MDVDQEKKKGEVDYTALDKDIASFVELAKKDLHAGIEGLLSLERTQRTAEALEGTRRCCSAILDACFAKKDWKQLNDSITALSKRRGQLKNAIVAFVRQAMDYVSQLPDEPTQVELIETLLAITAGKIFVEIERARLVKRLAHMKEAKGDVEAAADLIQEVPVETFGAMHRTEKVAFILEQVRLCLDRGDPTRAQILSKKISPMAFKVGKGSEQQFGIEGTAIQAAAEGTPPLQELRVIYYQLMMRFHGHHNDYLEVARCLLAIMEDETIAADAARWKPLLKQTAWYLALAPATVEQRTLMASTTADRKLKDLPVHREMLAAFTTQEICAQESFAARFGAAMEEETEIFAGEAGPKRREDLKLRLVEHNILVVAKYYSRVTLQRLSVLLSLTPAEVEKHLADMVTGGAVTAKIDRPTGVVRLATSRQPQELLNEWAGNVAKVLDVVERACQSIAKECMQHKVSLPSMPA
ncbi:unnamed protein product [Pedinophyceae sp. YPF-701]|nr:unnamed protein product [Pedinophyceae sp. YPF-701]